MKTPPIDEEYGPDAEVIARSDPNDDVQVQVVRALDMASMQVTYQIRIRTPARGEEDKYVDRIAFWRENA